VAAYAAVGLRDLALPGVYMDAVNPDYLVVRILNWNHAEPLDRLAVDLDAAPRKPRVYFPDWGLELPVIMLTGGRVPAEAEFRAEEARASLCSGRGFAVAAMGSASAARFARWAAELGAPLPRVTPYRERDGTVVFELATYAAPPEGCRVTPAGGR
jgi:hypothetical protein